MCPQKWDAKVKGHFNLIQTVAHVFFKKMHLFFCPSIFPPFGATLICFLRQKRYF
jgi:hypothetical protein